ncbi:MAG TPA: hypothetical protein VKW70_08560 [Terriglobia bacterium]|nr:hypothetical protein [Terriglobia bacterium]
MKTIRTTVDIPDPLYCRLKARAATERHSVKELILRSIEEELRGSEPKRSGKVKLPIVRSKKPRSRPAGQCRDLHDYSFSLM